MKKKFCNPCRAVAKQTGFAIVTAIFLLVVLAALGVFMLTISTTQQVTSMTDIEGSRAYWAAKSGIDWGIYQAKIQRATYACASGCVMTTINPSTCSGPITTAPAATNLAMTGFTVTVSCTCTPYCEANATAQSAYKRIFRLVATSCNQPSGGACPNASPTGTAYVERQVTATVFDCSDTDKTRC